MRTLGAMATARFGYRVASLAATGWHSAPPRLQVRALAKIPMEGGHYSLSDSTPLDKSLTAVGKNLKLRGVLLQLGCLRGSKGESADALDDVASSGMGVESMSKKPGDKKLAAPAPDVQRVEEVQALLAKSRQRGDEEFVDAEDLLKDPSAPRPGDNAKAASQAQAPAPKVDVGTGIDVRSKYADKLRQKKVSMAGLAGMGDTGGGDAEGLAFAKTLVQKRTGFGTASTWIMAAGAGPALEYLQHRSMKLGIVVHSREQEGAEKMVDGIVSQAKLHGISFDGIAGLSMTDFDVDEEELVGEDDANDSQGVAESKPAGPPKDLWNTFVDGLTSMGSSPRRATPANGTDIDEYEVKRHRKLLETALHKVGLDRAEALVVSDNDNLLQAAKGENRHCLAQMPPKHS
uniref:Uncharacterized protein n=1 Tax=Phaeomonas parva TaxID=124430 RepID=A0A7S1UGC8_9STRA|mmetsp:Transcript_45966/g.143842  ORF Transcript_45966/g.143842 Transcript_45966/m.143842 type:complete len:403 (+) Transcript_45966:128-1336(+)